MWSSSLHLIAANSKWSLSNAYYTCTFVRAKKECSKHASSGADLSRPRKVLLMTKKKRFYSDCVGSLCYIVFSIIFCYIYFTFICAFICRACFFIILSYFILFSLYLLTFLINFNSYIWSHYFIMYFTIIPRHFFRIRACVLCTRERMHSVCPRAVGRKAPGARNRGIIRDRKIYADRNGCWKLILYSARF